MFFPRVYITGKVGSIVVRDSEFDNLVNLFMISDIERYETLERNMITFENCLLSNNENHLNHDGPENNERGGVVYFSGVDRDFDIEFSSCEFIDNTCSHIGGAFYVRNASSLYVHQSVFNGNEAPDVFEGIGGVFSVVYVTKVTLSDCEFRDSVAGYSAGGGVVVFSDELTVTRCTFEYLRTTGFFSTGGGLLSQYVENTVISNSTFRLNSAYFGAGISTSYGTNLTMLDVVIESNVVDWKGGGVYSDSLTGTLKIERCTFKNNDGGLLTSSGNNLIIESSTFKNNVGGLLMSNGNNLIISGSLFVENVDPFGSGGGVSVNGHTGNVVIEESSIIRNKAYDGGGLYFMSGNGDVTLQNCVINQNEATYGGGMSTNSYWNFFTTIRLYGCNVTENVANYGGGVFFGGGYNLEIFNSRILSNRANLMFGFGGYGGGAYLESYYGFVTFDKIQLTNNEGFYGGGLLFLTGDGTFSLRNSLVTDNSVMPYADGNGGGVFLHSHYGTVFVSETEFLRNMGDYCGGLEFMNVFRANLERCTFEENEATYYGSGLYMDAVSYSTIQETFFRKNTALNYASGSYIVNSGSVTFNLCEFIENEATFRHGGGIMFENSNNLTIMGCLFQQNSANFGAGVYIDSSYEVGVYKSTFTENVATTGSGGGIYIKLMLEDVTVNYCLKITESTFHLNTADMFGGAVFVSNGKDLLVRNSEFDGNSGEKGGGSLSFSYSENIELDECKFKNGYSQVGGGHALFGELNKVILTDCVFGNGYAGQRAGGIEINFFEEVVVDNCTFFNDTSYFQAGAAAFSIGKSLVVRNSNFEQNSLTEDPLYFNIGGAVDCNNVDDVFFDGSTFTENYSPDFGGGIRVNGAQNLKVKECTFYKNVANLKGGGIIAENTSVVDIDGSIFVECFCISGVGGGVYISHSQTVRVGNSQFESNLAIYGSGVHIFRTKETFVEDSVFKLNKGAEAGGGFYVWGEFVFIMNSVFVENEAPSGGGCFIHQIQKVEVWNSSFTGNAAQINENIPQFSNYVPLSVFHMGGGLSIGNVQLNTTNSSPAIPCVYPNSTYCNLTDHNFTQDANVSIRNTIFQNNIANSGGGGMTNGLILNSFLHNVSFCGNKAPMGGGIQFSGVALRIVMEEVAFVNNTSDGSGSAFHIDNVGYTKNDNVRSGVFISRSVVRENKGGITGSNPDGMDGVCVINIVEGGVHIDFTVFSGNYYGESGATLAVVEVKDLISVCSCQFLENRAHEDNGATVSTMRFQQSNEILLQDVDILGFEQCCTEILGISLEEITLERVVARNSGGVLVLSYSSKATIVDSAFYDIDGTSMKRREGGEARTPFHFQGVYRTERDPITRVETFTDGVFIRNSTFDNLKADSGGVIRLEERNIANISDCVFRRCRAKRGGVIFSDGINEKRSQTKLKNDNIYLYHGPGLSVYSSIFDSNTASEAGGGIFSKGIRCLTHVQDSVFNNNVASRAADIYGISSYHMGIHNCTFSNSQATERISTDQSNELEPGSVFLSDCDSVIWNSSFYNCDRGGVVVTGGGSIDLQECKFENMKNGRAITVTDSTHNSNGDGFGDTLEHLPTIANVEVDNSSASDSSPNGGCILVIRTKVSYSIRDVHLNRCSGEFGGGFYTEKTRDIKVRRVVVDNSKSKFGGIWCYDDGSKIVDDHDKSNDEDFFLRFFGNEAEYLGNNFFINNYSVIHGNDTIMDLLGDDVDNFASPPVKIVFDSFHSESTEFVCEEDCSSKNYTFYVFSGEIFSISVKVVDFYGRVIKYYPSDKFRLNLESQSLLYYDDQPLFVNLEPSLSYNERYITTGIFRYGDLSLQQKNVKLKGELDITEEVLLRLFSSKLEEDFYITIRMKKCPPGFYIKNREYDVCEKCKQGENFAIFKNSLECYPCPDDVDCMVDLLIPHTDQYIYVNEENEDVLVIPCLEDRCTGGGKKSSNSRTFSSEINVCAGFRNSSIPACGACLDGYSDWEGKCVKCKNGINIGPLIIWGVLVIIIATMFFCNVQKRSGSVERIITSFNQHASLILSEVSWGKGVLIVTGYFFKFSIPSVWPSDQEGCPWMIEGFGKILLAYIGPISIVVSFLICFCCCSLFQIPYYFCVFYRDKKKYKGVEDDSKKDEEETRELKDINSKDLSNENSEEITGASEKFESGGEDNNIVASVRRTSATQEVIEIVEEEDIIFRTSSSEDERDETGERFAEFGEKNEEKVESEEEESGELGSQFSDEEEGEDEEKVEGEEEDEMEVKEGEEEAKKEENEEKVESEEEESGELGSQFSDEEEEEEEGESEEKVEGEEEDEKEVKEQEEEEKKKKEEEGEKKGKREENENENERKMLIVDMEDEDVMDPDVEEFIRFLKSSFECFRNCPKSSWKSVVGRINSEIKRTILMIFVQVENYILSIFLFFLVFYPVLIEKILVSFSCFEYEPGVWRIRVNTDIICNNGGYYAMITFFALIIWFCFFCLNPLFYICLRVNDTKVKDLHAEDEKDDRYIEKKAREKKRRMKLIFQFFDSNVCCRHIMLLVDCVCPIWKCQKYVKMGYNEEKSDEIDLNQAILADRLFGPVFQCYRVEVVLWYETYLLNRKFILTLLLVFRRIFLFGEIVDYMIIILLVLFLLIHVAILPYKRRLENILEFLSLFSLITLQTIRIGVQTFNEDNVGAILIPYLIMLAVSLMCKFSFVVVLFRLAIRLIVILWKLAKHMKKTNQSLNSISMIFSGRTPLSEFRRNRHLMFHRRDLYNKNMEKEEFPKIIAQYFEGFGDGKSAFTGDSKNIEVLKQIGFGTDAYVYLGSLKTNNEMMKNEKFAFKILKCTLEESIQSIGQKIENECASHSLHHRNLSPVPYYRQVIKLHRVYFQEWVDGKKPKVEVEDPEDPERRNYSGIIVMKHFTCDLIEFMSRRQRGIKPFPLTRIELNEIMREMVNGIKYMHDKGFCHRDLHPGNVFNDGGWRMVIADHGMARFFEEKDGMSRWIESTKTDNSEAFGADDYIPPELVEKFEDKNDNMEEDVLLDYETCDIYSVGRIGLYIGSYFGFFQEAEELLSLEKIWKEEQEKNRSLSKEEFEEKEKEFNRKSMDLKKRKLEKEKMYLKNNYPRMGRLILKMMDEDPKKRPGYENIVSTIGHIREIL